jgi:hypothetical protein
MTKLRLNMTMSLDGYVAGPNQSVTHPLGEGGDEIHKWAFAVRSFREWHGMLPAQTPVPDDAESGTVFASLARTNCRPRNHPSGNQFAVLDGFLLVRSRRAAPLPPTGFLY